MYREYCAVPIQSTRAPIGWMDRLVYGRITEQTRYLLPHRKTRFGEVEFLGYREVSQDFVPTATNLV